MYSGIALSLQEAGHFFFRKVGGDFDGKGHDQAGIVVSSTAMEKCFCNRLGVVTGDGLATAAAMQGGCTGKE